MILAVQRNGFDQVDAARVATRPPGNAAAIYVAALRPAR
jgi:hypothetical protein